MSPPASGHQRLKLRVLSAECADRFPIEKTIGGPLRTPGEDLKPRTRLERDEIAQEASHGRAKRVQVWIERPRWPRLHLAMKLAGHCCLLARCALPEATVQRRAIKSEKVMRFMPSVRTQTRQHMSLNICSPSGMVRCLACRRLLKLCRNS